MKFKDDGMQHTYSTCPQCRCIVSDENIVTVDGRVMCRRCMQSLAEKLSLRAVPHDEKQEHEDNTFARGGTTGSQ